MLNKRITAIASAIVVFLIVLSTVVILVPLVLSISPYIVKDETMAPAYQKGGVVFIEEKEPEKILVGDVITYFENQGESVKTRRVVAVEQESNGYFVKGDTAQQMEMGMVHKRNLIGQPLFFIPYIGFFLIKGFIEIVKISLIVVALVLTTIAILVQRERLKESVSQRNNEEISF